MEEKNQASDVTLVLEQGFTKEHIQFSVYDFLIRCFDNAFLGYPVVFVFPDEDSCFAKIYLSASEVGARIADFLEVRPKNRAIIHIGNEGTMIYAVFSSDETNTVCLDFLNAPILGHC